MMDTYASILAAIFGGVGLKIIEKLMSKKAEQFTEALRIRDELRSEIEKLREEQTAYREDADEWRTKYYTEVEERVKLVAEMELVRAELTTLKMTLKVIDQDEG